MIGKKLLGYVLLFTLITSCTSRTGKTDLRVGKVVIKGKVEMSDNCSRVISLSYSCSADKCDSGAAILDSKGNFRFEFEALHSQDVLLKYENGLAILFIEPSDSLTLSLNSQSFKNEQFPEYEITGKNSDVSKDIWRYLHYKNIDSFQPDIKNKSLDGYLADLKRQIFIEDSTLSVFSRKYNPSPLFVKWAEKNIIYSNANYLLDFKIYHEVNKSGYNGELFDKNLFPVNDDDAIVSSLYSYHLGNYSNKYFYDDTLVKKLIDDNRPGLAYKRVLSNIIENEEPGISRDLICYRVLMELLEKSYEEFLILADDTDTFIDNRDLLSLINNWNLQNKPGDSYHISSLYSNTKEEKEILGDVFRDLSDIHKDKPMYIDIWATWCGPCLSEIPHSIALQKHFEEEDIVFVNLCLSSDKAEWERAKEDYNLPGENYYFDKAQSELLRSKIGIAGYPTYLLIDRKGNVVNDDAPRPSSGEIIKVNLVQLLSE